MTDKFDLGKKPDPREALLREAWRSLEDGCADREQGAIIIRHLAVLTGYYNATTLEDWLKLTTRSEGYDMACIEAQARRSVFAKIIPYLTRHPDGRYGPTDQEVALEKAARAEAR